MNRAAVIVAKGTIAPSWPLEESEVESCKHQDNADIHCQSLPKSVFEEQEIYTDYDGYHRHHVKSRSYSSVHFRLAFSIASNTLIGRTSAMIYAALKGAAGSPFRARGHSIS